MTSSIYIGNLSESVINPFTDRVLSITPDSSSTTGYSPRAAIISTVESSSYSLSSSIALSSNNSYDQSLNTTNDVIFYNLLVSGSLTIGNYTLPLSRGMENQIIATNGSGSLYWTDSLISSSYKFQFVESTVSSSFNPMVSMIIPNNQMWLCKLNIIGRDDNENVGVWMLEFSLKNHNMTSSFVNNVLDDGNLSYAPTGSSVTIDRQSFISNNLMSSSIVLNIDRPNVFNIRVFNPLEISGSYGTVWSSTLDMTTI